VQRFVFKDMLSSVVPVFVEAFWPITLATIATSLLGWQAGSERISHIKECCLVEGKERKLSAE
jgi:hypothetical protein